MLWDSHSQMSGEAAAGTALAAGMNAHLVVHALPSQPCRITDLHRQRSPCTSALSSHRQWGGLVPAKTQGGRGSMPGPRQMKGRPQHLPQGLPPSLATPSPAPSQEVRATEGRVPLPSHSTPHSVIFRKGFPAHNRTGFWGVFRIP